MKKIYFVRHGQSQANADEVSAGSEFDTPLTPKGRTQAAQTGQILKGKGIELIVSSTLSRAIDTAKIIAEQIGYNPKDIIKVDYFVERNNGIYSHKPEHLYLSDALADSLHESVESVDDMHKRITEGLEWLEEFEEQVVLIVSHGGVSRVLRLMHQALPHSHMYKIDRLPNASIYEFTM